MSMMSEFRAFAVKGNVIDLAVAVIIGAAFGRIVESLVKDLVMPIAGAIFGGLDFSNYFIVLASTVPDGIPRTYEALTKAGVPLFAYGNFITVLINFLILAFLIFQMVRLFNRAQRLVITQRRVAPPAPPPEEVQLLREIRDSLKRPA